MGEENCLEQMNLSLEEFLKTRGLSNDEIENMKLENIDEATIQVMDEEVFKKYIPRLGDRIAVKNFCQRKLLPKKNGLIEKLRQKMAARNARSDNKGASSHVLEPKKHRKTTRAIELGFMAFNDTTKQLTQVRLNKGGGTRKVDVDRTSKNKDILEFAKKLFFPNNISKTFGPIENFTISLLDFCKSPVDTDLTVEEMYNETKVNKLRFYLSIVKCKEGGNDLPLVDDSSENEMVFDLCDDFENDIVSNQSTQPSTVAYREDDINQPSTSNISGYLASFIEENINLQSHQEDMVSFRLDHNDTSPEFFNLHTVDIGSLHDNDMSEKSSTEKLILHRGNVFRELIDAVKNRNISFKNMQIEMVLPNGKTELAEDLGGVLRDTISEFFNTFYETCTMGTELKVPCLRHDFQKEEWSAIGHIIKESFVSEKYFPIRIAPAFFKSSLDEPIDNDEVLENFLKFVSHSDAVLLRNSLQNFEDADEDDLLEFCTNYDAKCLPNKHNLKVMLEQIAKEEILQKPSFVRECIRPHLNYIKHILNIDYIFSAYQPTDRNIISLFKVDENLSHDKKQIVQFLKKFIKESDEKTRSSFLRFCTGSDLPIGKITIDFISTDGFARVPIAHTCSSILQIPTTYENFLTFRNEFNNLLSSNVWVMDMV
ncbi:hypothetical protein PPYR_01039 [Photinus pyralis]|uniref:HECT domain-containing protein n=3 Tax=Photinus pyralis TaxID=7054 RepID=A0A5N4B383_PHOPY|nr:uncharacterized protein LOC116160047 [Photinus pyralis]XP_031352244.1 uncharacterized protein LOC116177406 [Photinus pyralis]KAB0804069.1 hypothetical protein PPYR_01039 [Photinus pyralis]